MKSLIGEARRLQDLLIHLNGLVLLLVARTINVMVGEFLRANLLTHAFTQDRTIPSFRNEEVYYEKKESFCPVELIEYAVFAFGSLINIQIDL